MAAQVHTHDIHVFFFLYLLIISQLLVLSNSSPVNGGVDGFSLEIVHRDSIESPLYPGNLTIEERVERLVQQSKARARYLTLRKLILANITSGAIHPDAARIPVYAPGSNYIAKVGLGTFNERQSYKTYSLDVDTGSDLTWTQLEGCINCFPQSEPLFPNTRSSSYGFLPCDGHDLCELGKCYGQACSYSVMYGDGSMSYGILGHERLTLPSEENGREHFNNFILGFGLNQQNFHEDGSVSGILGLSGGEKSFVRQVGGNRFSYCLQPSDGSTRSTYIRFGSNANIGSNTGERVYTTPITLGPDDFLYYLNLVDVSVGGRRLRFRPGTFSFKTDGTGGCQMDSGTPLTHFERRHYLRIKQAVLDYYQFIPALRQVNLNNGYDLCLRKPNENFNNYPKITYHFDQGADFVAENGFLSAGGLNFCLSIIPAEAHLRNGGVMIGAVQSINHRVLVDLNGMQLSFVKERC